MCPRVHEERLKALYDHTTQENYTLRKDLSVSSFMEHEQAFGRLFPDVAKAPKLERHAPPYAYMLPKDKDPANKGRPVVSYYNHPNKTLLKASAQAFMWMLKEIDSKGLAQSFVQFNTSDFTKTVQQKIATLCEKEPQGNLKAYLGDIKNMYTNIPHPALFEAIDWVMDLVKKLPESQHGVAIKRKQNGKSGARWATPQDQTPTMQKLWKVISIDTMVAIMHHDIENIFFTVGDTMIQQTLGIPMGSPCSPALAIALCMHAEHRFLSHHPTPHKFVGFRYIDDLLVFYKDDTTPGNSATKQEITGIYPQPLELEEEDINNGTLRYLEHWIAFSANGDLGVQHYHKNSHRIREGKPPLKNVVDHSSFTPCGYQFGRIVGAMHRIVNSSIGHHNITQGCIVMLDELIHQMQFPKTLIKQAIQHMIATVPQHQSAWGALAIYYTHSR